MPRLIQQEITYLDLISGGKTAHIYNSRVTNAEGTVYLLYIYMRYDIGNLTCSTVLVQNIEFYDSLKRYFICIFCAPFTSAWALVRVRHALENRIIDYIIDNRDSNVLLPYLQTYFQ